MGKPGTSTGALPSRRPQASRAGLRHTAETSIFSSRAATFQAESRKRRLRGC